jgi:hypothetical protein
MAIAFLLSVAANGSLSAQMTAEEFESLPESDRRTVLVSSLQEWQRAVLNLQAKSMTHIYNVEYRDGVTENVVQDIGRYTCELRRLDGNHWAKVAWFLPGDDPNHPLAQIVTTMDTKAGVSRSFGEHRQMKGVYGAIATEEDHMIRNGRLHYWFEASFEKSREFPIVFLLEHQDEIEFEGLSDDRQQIKVSLRYKSSSGTPFQDSRTVWIDPLRGFLPVRMHRRWEYDTRPQPPLDQVWDLDVKSTRQVDGAWLPDHIVEVSASTASIADGYVSIFETSVEEIKLGVMDQSDLRIEFPDGVEVHDRIRGVWFKAGPRVQSAPPDLAKPHVPEKSRRWLILVNIGFLAVVAILWSLVGRRKLQKVSQQ